MSSPSRLVLRVWGLTLLLLSACLLIAPGSAVELDESQLQALISIRQEVHLLGWDDTSLLPSCDDGLPNGQPLECNATGFPTRLSLYASDGPIPEAIASLVALKYMRIFYNINGTLPSSWSALKDLETIDIFGNKQFTSALPEEWSSMTSLKSLSIQFSDYLYHSDMRPIASSPPSWLGNLVEVELIHAYWPNATLPSSIGNSSTLTSFVLRSCAFAGDFPAGLFSNTIIQRVSIGSSSTDFGKGLVLPSDLSGMTNLSAFGVTGGGFTGSIPTSFPSTLRSFEMGDLPHIEGSVPQILLDLPNIQSITLARMRKINGSIPRPTDISASTISELTFIDLSLSGTIPSSLLRLQVALRIAGMGGIVGPFPTAPNDCKIKYLQAFTLLGFSGEPLPVSVLRNCHTLTGAWLQNNGFTGQIPSFTAGNSLNFLLLSNNPFGGTIPKITFRKRVDGIYLDNCDLLGTVPTYLLNSTAFNVLDLGRNRLDLCSNSREILETGFVNSPIQQCTLSYQMPAECGCADVWPADCFSDRPMAPECEGGPIDSSPPIASSPPSILSFFVVALFASIAAMFIL